MTDQQQQPVMPEVSPAPVVAAVPSAPPVSAAGAAAPAVATVPGAGGAPNGAAGCGASDVATDGSLVLPAKRDAPLAASAAGEAKRATGEADVLCVKREDDRATLPSRGSAQAAGYDLSASEAAVIPKGGRAVVSTGLSISVPIGCYGRVAPRSGLAVKKGLDVGAGVIDSDYRGVVGVVLFNFGQEDVSIAQGDRIAQLIIERIATPRVVEVASLDETDRGAGGFGSTGVATTN